MNEDILKLIPKKAFKLIPIRVSLKISAQIAKSVFDKKSYEIHFNKRVSTWKFDDIQLINAPSHIQKTLLSKEDGEKILTIYFSQFFEKNIATHIDLRSNSFLSGGTFTWNPSKLHYAFSEKFLNGVCSLYTGFYLDDSILFDEGLNQLGMIKKTMSINQKEEIKNLFYMHFGEGKSEPVQFKIAKLQESFEEIFSFFIKEDIPLNPEFAVLGVCLVTLYLTLQDIPHKLNVRNAFQQVIHKYKK